MKVWELEFCKHDAYLNDIRKQAEMLLDKHGLWASGWRFHWNSKKTEYGLCNWSQKTINVSYLLAKINPFSETLDTILHEIAHALVGSGNGHNRIWKQKALQIGCNGERCHTANTAKPKYIGYCPNCGKEQGRHRRTIAACGDCCKKYNMGYFSIAYKIEFRENE